LTREGSAIQLVLETIFTKEIGCIEVIVKDTGGGREDSRDAVTGLLPVERQSLISYLNQKAM
jgi:hypothetical protein